MNRILAYNQYRTRQKNFQVIPTEVANNDHKFRDEILDPEKPHFMVKVKYNTGVIGGWDTGTIADSRPQESINKDAKIQLRLQLDQEERMDRMLNITHGEKKPWVENIPCVDRRHMMGRGAYPFLEKGMFDEDQLNQVNMGGADLDDKAQFKLFFRTLGTRDRKDIELGRE
jgi:hypothetical protein